MADSIVVKHLGASLQIPTGYPPSLESVLSSVLHDDLPLSMERARTIAGDGLRLIRQVNVEVSIDVNWPSRRIAETIASAWAKRLDEILRAGADGFDVLWFPTRAAYVARLLADIADGRAEGKWYYGGFETALARPASAAFARVICAEECAHEAIREMLPSEIRSMLRQIGESHAAEIMHRFASEIPADLASMSAISQSVPEVLDEVRHSTPAQAAFRLFVYASRQRPISAGPLASAAIQASSLVIRAASMTPARRMQLAEVVADFSLLGDGIEESLAEALALIANWPVSSRSELRDSLVPQSPASTDSGYSRFGGALVLASLVRQMLPDPRWRAVRWLACVGALGSSRYSSVLSDPVIQRAFGIDESFDWTDVDVAGALRAYKGSLGDEDETWVRAGRTPIRVHARKNQWTQIGGVPLRKGLKDVADDHDWVLPPKSTGLTLAARRGLAILSQGLLREFAWRLPGFAGSSIPFLYENFLDFDATVTSREEYVEVAVGDPPLHLVLTLAGMNRSAFDVGGVEWKLSRRQ